MFKWLLVLFQRVLRWPRHTRKEEQEEDEAEVPRRPEPVRDLNLSSLRHRLAVHYELHFGKDLNVLWGTLGAWLMILVLAIFWRIHKCRRRNPAPRRGRPPGRPPPLRKQLSTRAIVPIAGEQGKTAKAKHHAPLAKIHLQPLGTTSGTVFETAPQHAADEELLMSILGNPKKEREKPQASAKQVIRVLCASRAHALAIALRGNRNDAASIARTLRAMDWNAVDEGFAQCVMGVFPTEAERKNLAEHMHELEKVRDIDRQAAILATVPRGASRLELLVLARRCEEDYFQARRALRVIRSACVQLYSSARLQKLMAMVVSAANKADGRFDASGFCLQGLLQLPHAKGSSGLSIVHFVTIECRLKSTDFDRQLQEELQSVPEASRWDSQDLPRRLKDLLTARQSALVELRNGTDEYYAGDGVGDLGVARAKLIALATRCRVFFRSLKKDVERTALAINACEKYLCFTQSKDPVSDTPKALPASAQCSECEREEHEVRTGVLRIVASFMESFAKAWKDTEVRQRNLEKIEKRLARVDSRAHGGSKIRTASAPITSRRRSCNVDTNVNLALEDTSACKKRHTVGTVADNYGKDDDDDKGCCKGNAEPNPPSEQNELLQMARQRLKRNSSLCKAYLKDNEGSANVKSPRGAVSPGPRARDALSKALAAASPVVKSKSQSDGQEGQESKCTNSGHDAMPASLALALPRPKEKKKSTSREGRKSKPTSKSRDALTKHRGARFGWSPSKSPSTDREESQKKLNSAPFHLAEPRLRGITQADQQPQLGEISRGNASGRRWVGHGNGTPRGQHRRRCSQEASTSNVPLGPAFGQAFAPAAPEIIPTPSALTDSTSCKWFGPSGSDRPPSPLSKDTTSTSSEMGVGVGFAWRQKTTDSEDTLSIGGDSSNLGDNLRRWSRRDTTPVRTAKKAVKSVAVEAAAPGERRWSRTSSFK